MEFHNIPPLFDENSEILILGSFPSQKSRQAQFFYGHPQNRFWAVLSAVLGVKLPQSIEEKREMLFSHKIALWDVIASCEIVGSSDSSIKNVVPNDILGVLNQSKIKRIFVNGKAAEKYYNKYIFPNIKIAAKALPSTSPANAAYSLSRLIEEWKVILENKK